MAPKREFTLWPGSRFPVRRFFDHLHKLAANGQTFNKRSWKPAFRSARLMSSTDEAAPDLAI
jgi:hypothetical protein